MCVCVSFRVRVVLFSFGGLFFLIIEVYSRMLKINSLTFVQNQLFLMCMHLESLSCMFSILNVCL